MKEARFDVKINNKIKYNILSGKNRGGEIAINFVILIPFSKSKQK